MIYLGNLKKISFLDADAPNPVFVCFVRRRRVAFLPEISLTSFDCNKSLEKLGICEDLDAAPTEKQRSATLHQNVTAFQTLSLTPCFRAITFNSDYGSNFDRTITLSRDNDNANCKIAFSL